MSETFTNQQEFSNCVDKLQRNFKESINSSADADGFKEENYNNSENEAKEQKLSESERNHLEQTIEQAKAREQKNMTNNASRTEQEFRAALKECRNIFIDKIKDYGVSWKFLRPMSVTDQLLIKAYRKSEREYILNS